MRILVTGASGFLGSHLALALLNRGDQVWAYRRAQTDLRRFAGRENEIEWFDIAELQAPFSKEVRINSVIHAATCYGRHKELVSQMIDINTRLPVSLYEHCKAARVSAFLNIHTALPRSLNAYALSKHHLVDWLALSQGNTKTLHLRTEHFYGPGDNGDKFVEWLFRRLRAGDNVPLTKGEQERDFLYIDDAVSAILTCLDKAQTDLGQTEMLDIGSGQAITIRSLAERCQNLIGPSGHLHFGAVPYRLNEVMRSVADISRLTALGWKATIPLEEGLRRVAGAHNHR